MSDNEDDEETFCPLCVEEMDLSDRNFLPCPCGYRVKNIVLHFNTLAIKNNNQHSCIRCVCGVGTISGKI
jgi:hypothetical protein